MGVKDGASDLYFFKFGKYSGEFFLDKSGNIKLSSQQDLKFEMLRPTNREITGFNVNTPEGTRYEFKSVEQQQVINASGITRVKLDGSESEYTGLFSPNNGPFFGLFYRGEGEGNRTDCNDQFNKLFYNSSWKLTKIKSLVTGDSVLFNYSTEKVFSRSYSNERLQNFVTPSSATYFTRCFKIRSITAIYSPTLVLSDISWSGGSVLFQREPFLQRLDMEPRRDQWNQNPHYPYYDCKSYKLNAITIMQRAGFDNLNEIKRFTFSQSYFNSASPNFTDVYNTNYSELNDAFSKRLRLDSIKENNLAPYIFNYNSTSLPHRASTQQDHWGYYTPNNSNSLIPKLYEYKDEVINDSSYFTSLFSFYHRNNYVGTEVEHNEFAWDRSCNETAMKAASLEEIVYPTGGGTKYFYEPNEFYVGGQKIKGGGMRIKKIVTSPDRTYNETKDLTKIYDYNESGKVVDLPTYASYRYAPGLVVYNGSWSAGFAVTKGGFVGYSKVSVISPNNGKTVYNYLTPAMFGSYRDGIYLRPTIKKRYTMMYSLGGHPTVCVLPSSYIIGKYDYYPKPFTPNYEWERGALEKMEIYDENNVLKIKKRFTYNLNNYEIIKNLQVDINGVDERKTSNEEMQHNECWFGNHNYNYAKSFDISAWLVPDSTITYDYYQNGDSLITSNKMLFQSNNHKQQTGNIIGLSDGNSLITKMKYSTDYNTNGNLVDMETDAIRLMKQKNIISSPLEISTFKSDGSIENLVNSNLVTYKYFGLDSLLVPSKKFKIQLNQPLANFQPSLISSSILSKDSRYKEQINYNQYDMYGNPLEFTEIGGLKNSFIWSNNIFFPNDNYLMAKVANGSQSEIAATSFEDIFGKGNWEISGNLSGLYVSDGTAPTGKMVCNLSGLAITKSGLNSTKTYIVTYWIKNSNPLIIPGTKMGFPISGKIINGWKYFEHKVTGESTISISGNSAIDELRLYPEKAIITTYTYERLIGITSECNVNNNIKYYEYDASNRLILIRDQDKNIVKRICYNYSGQIEDCPIINNTDPQWRVSGNTRCQPCTTNPIYNNGVREKEEKDINPYSPTFNNTRWLIDPTGTCPLAPPIYAPRNDLAYCENINGVNTGNLITPTYDSNPCSPTYFTFGPNTITPNHPPCLPCPACISHDYKCINGVCTLGILKVVRVRRLTKYTWECSKALCFPDGSFDGNNLQTFTSSTPCDIECF
jgi:hypothetical protein